MIETLVYSSFFSLALISALLVVFSRHAIYCALYLVITMISIAGLFVMINAQLAAVLQVIVYTGAIMVLFLFVIMLLNIRRSAEPPIATQWIRRVGIFLFGAMLIQGFIIVGRFSSHMIIAEGATDVVSVGSVAEILMTRYIYAFEATSIMLLIAVIGSMVLAKDSVTRNSIEPREGS